MIDRVAALTQILGQDPGDAFARYALALEYAGKGDTASALQQFDMLLARHPDHIAGHFMAAQTLQGVQRTAEAIEHLQLGIVSAMQAGEHKAMAEMQAMLDELQAPSSEGK
ncbi:MAG: tetratricopeptide repeat protein [Acidobacteriaceae bacterium]